MKSIIEQGKQSLIATTEKLTGNIDFCFNLIKEVVNGLPVLISVERSKARANAFDEMHYFVIPNKLSEVGFSLHTTRYLPLNVLEVNDLPKRRVFHFPGDYYEACLREEMLKSAREIALEQCKGQTSSLEQLANDIDALDSKLTYGMLVVGGLAAILNPIVGATIAAKALLPSVTGLFNKYGLRFFGEKLTQSSIEKNIRAAEESVLNEFSESLTIKIINPILQELEFALRTDEEEHDPLIDPNLANGKVTELRDESWRQITEKAIYHVYKDIYLDHSKHEKANIGPEDVRWLKTIFANIEDPQKTNL